MKFTLIIFMLFAIIFSCFLLFFGQKLALLGGEWQNLHELKSHRGKRLLSQLLIEEETIC